MALKMRDLPRLTASILFKIDKRHKIVELAHSVVQNPEDEVAWKDLEAAIADFHDPRNTHTVCKVLIPKLSAKVRKLQDEGMYIVGINYEEAEPQPEVPEQDFESDLPPEGLRGPQSIYDPPVEPAVSIPIAEVENPETKEES